MDSISYRHHKRRGGMGRNLLINYLVGIILVFLFFGCASMQPQEQFYNANVNSIELYLFNYKKDNPDYYKDNLYMIKILNRIVNLLKEKGYDVNIADYKSDYYSSFAARYESIKNKSKTDAVMIIGIMISQYNVYEIPTEKYYNLFDCITGMYYELYDNKTGAIILRGNPFSGSKTQCVRGLSFLLNNKQRGFVITELDENKAVIQEWAFDSKKNVITAEKTIDAKREDDFIDKTIKLIWDNLPNKNI
jgi:hypothetical protein